MWEQIRANKRNSALLMAVMASVLLGLGFMIGYAIAPGAGLIGLAVAGGIWLVMTLVSLSSGDKILLCIQNRGIINQALLVLDQCQIRGNLGSACCICKELNLSLASEKPDQSVFHFPSCL